MSKFFVVTGVLVIGITQVLRAQPAFISTIDFYGLKHVDEIQLRKTLNLREGDSLDPRTFSQKALEEKLLMIPGVTRSNVSPVCCSQKDGGWMLYIGIDESKTAFSAYNSSYQSADTLNAEIVNTYEQFENVLGQAVIKGQATEDDSKGHVLLDYPPAKQLQDKFLTYANNYLHRLKKVLRHSTNARHRAISAWIIPYTAKKKEIIPDLLYAVNDPDDVVRNNATRALGVLGKYALANKEKGIVIPPGPFINMLNSLTWTDRNKGAMVLEALSSERDSLILATLREKALPALLEMSRWKNSGHAFTAFVMLGRIAGVSDVEIYNHLSDEKRNNFVDELQKKIDKE